MKTRTQKKNKSDLKKEFIKGEIDLSSDLNLQIFDRFFEIIIDSVKENKNVELRNFGVFKLKKMKSRIGLNPQNQKKIYIPEKSKLSFKISPNLLNKINE